MRFFMFVSSLAGAVVLGQVALNSSEFQRLRAGFARFLPPSDGYSRMANQAGEFDRRIAAIDESSRSVCKQRDQFLAGRDQDASLLADLERLADDPYSRVSREQMREAVIAVRAGRAGDSRKLDALDEHVRLLVQQRLAVLQEKKDLFDEQYRAVLREYANELIRTSKLGR